ncbi:hypothetical protein Afil01_29020 [Actinorhabdospora filicis]|uniref:Ricin B lectin domain-containing protein n=1 Tax=Actinorhabdospora filicis TaxID=1785913 RepID=A0A9W6WAW7_9ACTN|nr:ricin-type beta-trefoil lectin domain protein [Actinorhabdospora filicis]GLZ78095.1 hypothetical protein Afil01_29020 [Actinorhabdospora filicis]
MGLLLVAGLLAAAAPAGASPQTPNEPLAAGAFSLYTEETYGGKPQCTDRGQNYVRYGWRNRAVTGYQCELAGQNTIMYWRLHVLIEGTTVSPAILPTGAIYGQAEEDISFEPCLGLANASPPMVIIDVCNGASPGQRWTWMPNHTVRNQNGQCLDVQYGNTGNGSRLVTWACDAAKPNQIWDYDDSGRLVNPATGKCVDDPSHFTSPNRQAELWACIDADWQRWDPPRRGELESAMPGNWCVQVTGDHEATLGKCAYGAANQTWQLFANGDVIDTEGRCLDVYKAGTANGTKVLTWPCKDQPNQKWELTPTGLRNPASGRCLDIYKSILRPDVGLEIWDCHGTQNQRWTYL